MKSSGVNSLSRKKEIARYTGQKFRKRVILPVKEKLLSSVAAFLKRTCDDFFKKSPFLGLQASGCFDYYKLIMSIEEIMRKSIARLRDF